MKYPVIVTVFLIALCAVSLASCKKKNNGDPLDGSKIVAVNYTNTNGDAIYYRIVYDVHSNVDSIISIGGGTDTGNNGFLAFNYLNSSYQVNNSYNIINTVDINANLMIDTIFGPGSAENYIIYNGTEIGSVNVKTSSGASVNIFNYTYNNGDIAAINTSGSSITYDYNTNRNGQLGDPQRINQFLSYGRAYESSSHLATGMYMNGTLLEKYNYQFDGQGRITQLTWIINNGSGALADTATYDYLYNY